MASGLAVDMCVCAPLSHIAKSRLPSCDLWMDGCGECVAVIAISRSCSIADFLVLLVVMDLDNASQNHMLNYLICKVGFTGKGRVSISAV